MDPKEDSPTDYILPPKGKQPLIPPSQSAAGGADQALNLIRNKIDQLYTHEPNARQELAEVEGMHTKRSNHQQFMHELSGSGNR